MPPLNPNGGPVNVGNITLRTPGLKGRATALPTHEAPTRSLGATRDDPFESVFATEHLTRTDAVEISETEEVDTGTASTRSTVDGEPAIELEVAGPGEEAGQLVRVIDESGAVNWYLPADSEGKTTVTRGGGTLTYRIRRSVAPEPASAETRALALSIGKKIIEVFVFPLIDPIVGNIAGTVALEWEKRTTAYRVGKFGPKEYLKPLEPLTDEEWARVAKGRALLFVHGTFGQAHVAFPTLPLEIMEKLDKCYEGRLIAFDHFTVSEDPIKNAQWFIDLMPKGTKLELDIISHSRGGLVSRAIAEAGPGNLVKMNGRELLVRKVIFAGAPNAGCVLANADHMVKFIDRYTNWIALIPGIPAAQIAGGVLSVLKQLATAGFKGLDGLTSMDPHPSGKFLKRLDGINLTRKDYFALAADYDPKNEGIKRALENKIIDEIYGVENDMVCPTTSAYENAEAKGRFPIDQSCRLVFNKADNVHHGGFFANDRAQKKMLEWLGCGP